METIFWSHVFMAKSDRYPWRAMVLRGIVKAKLRDVHGSLDDALLALFRADELCKGRRQTVPIAGASALIEKQIMRVMEIPDTRSEQPERQGTLRSILESDDFGVGTPRFPKTSVAPWEKFYDAIGSKKHAGSAWITRQSQAHMMVNRPVKRDPFPAWEVLKDFASDPKRRLQDLQKTTNFDQVRIGIWSLNLVAVKLMRQMGHEDEAAHFYHLNDRVYGPRTARRSVVKEAREDPREDQEYAPIFADAKPRAKPERKPVPTWIRK